MTVGNVASNVRFFVMIKVTLPLAEAEAFTGLFAL